MALSMVTRCILDALCDGDSLSMPVIRSAAREVRDFLTPTPAPEDDAAADARIDAILDDRKDADAIKAAAVRQRAEHRATYGPESPAPEAKRPTCDWFDPPAPCPPPVAGSAELVDPAYAAFREYVEANYKDGVILGNVSWHIPRLWRAAKDALSRPVRP